MMSMSYRLASKLLITSALVLPSAAWAQAAPPPASSDDAQDAPPSTTDQDDQSGPEISAPGADDIVIIGRTTSSPERTAPQVLTLLTAQDIARTGDGDIASSLGRVTGLSVVGNGYVYVRGLGDRYSLAMLNGLELPSPEPLKRVVPLDIFPTSVLASAFVQKSYSVNYPGEFGGGVVNLTTKSAPKDGFLTIGGSIGMDTRTTGQLGYTYFGSPTDGLGYDNGQRDIPPALASFLAGGDHISNLSIADKTAIASQLILPRVVVAQRNTDIPANWSGNITAGKSFDLGGTTLGVIATGGYSNKWLTRDVTQQVAGAADLSSLFSDFERVITDHHIVVNGLLGMGLEFGRNRIRWTNLYIHDTVKQTRIGLGVSNSSGGVTTQSTQDTAFFERQLIDTQLVGEFKFDVINIDARFGYANSKRKSPYESSFRYFLADAGPYAGLFYNALDSNAGSASVSFQDLDENLWTGGIDVSIPVANTFTASAGWAVTARDRISTNRQFSIRANNQSYGTFNNPQPWALFSPNYLLEPSLIQFLNGQYAGGTPRLNVDVTEDTEGSPAFKATLVTHAFYLKGRWMPSSAVTLEAGFRYEAAKQTVAPYEVFQVAPFNTAASNKIDRDYFLPAATLTWEFASRMQLRVSGSKTIARPQFRELLNQGFYDPDSNRIFSGNPYLTDSQIWNAEARWEWYFAREQTISVAAFYKHLDKPIEQYQFTFGNGFNTSFANAPAATLYGAELELKKYFDLSDWGGLFASRRLVVIGNYTYTHSNVKVKAGDTTIGSTSPNPIAATDLFLDGRPLTGQSDHLANLQIGLENKDHLSQQTFILNYASDRLVARGALPLPDVYERPGLHLDFVMRQGIRVAGMEFEAKFEARNITGTAYEEFQESGSTRVYQNKYQVGRQFNLGLSVTF